MAKVGTARRLGSSSHSGQVRAGRRPHGAAQAGSARRSKTKASSPTLPARPARAAAAVDHTVAEALARKQREITVSEFFAKNRHLLGFDNRRKALLNTVKEAVDNSLDACEEARVLPDLEVRVEQIGEYRYRVRVTDNGPGIVRQQVPNIFGKLLYGSKFHRLKMSRGQQGIGISAAAMYGLLTTARPIQVISRTGPGRQAHRYEVAIDTKKNRPEVIADEPCEADFEHGTMVQIELEGSYNKGRQSVDEYLEQTAIANPHARLVYYAPTGQRSEFARASNELPPEPREIKPHPHGIELGMLMRMLKDSSAKHLGGFLRSEFSRLGGAAAKQIASRAGLTTRTWTRQIGPSQAEALYRAMQSVRLKAPPTDCLVPIGARQILAGLLKELKAEFFTAATRNPTVYRGNPFLIEAGLAYGGQLPSEEPARLIRFANRVPLLYQQSHCCIYRSVLEINWRGYGISQSRGALPTGPLVIMVHIASAWVPFTSESKEAIADYDEIRREVKLALQECGRKLAAYLNRRARQRREGQRRSLFERYVGEVVEAVHAIRPTDREALRRNLLAVARRRTAQADLQADQQPRAPGSADDDGQFGPETIIVGSDARQPLGQAERHASQTRPAQRQRLARRPGNRRRAS